MATSVPLLASKAQIIYNRTVEDFEYKSPERSSSSEDSSADNDDTKATTKQSLPSHRDDGKERSSWFGDDTDKAEAKQPSLYDLFEQQADPEPPLENLALDEQALVADELSNLHLDVANQELAGTEPGSPAEAAAIAGATFNEAVRERLDNGEAPTEAVLDAAMKDTADIMGLDSKEIPEGDSPLELSDDEARNLDDRAKSKVVAGEPQLEPEDTQAQMATISPPSPGGPAMPPTPPLPPHMSPPGAGNPPPPGGPGGPVGGGPGPQNPGGGFNNGPVPPIMPAVPWANPNIAGALASRNAIQRSRRHNHWPYVLAGGVVGYFIGRRRGRIRTEKKLKPIQQKLEQQVGDLQFQLALREAKVRKLAYEKAITHPHIHAALPKRLKELQELQRASREQAEQSRAQNKKPVAEKTTETVSGKYRKKAEKMQEAGLAAKVIQMTERERPVTNEQDMPKELSKLGESTSPPHMSLTEIARAKDMPIHDILVVAEQIPLEGRTLRMLYETGRISQYGLRRVIEEYLRGGRYDRVLWEELQSSESVRAPLAASSTSAVHETDAPMTSNPPVVIDDKAERDEGVRAYIYRQAGDEPGQTNVSSVIPKVAAGVIGAIAIIMLIIFFT